MPEINPQEFGAMRAEVTGLRRDSDRATELLDKVFTKLESIERQLSEAKGGWKTLMWIGGAAASLGGFISWVAHEFVKR